MMRWIETFNSNDYNINPKRKLLLKEYLENLRNESILSFYHNNMVLKQQ